MLSQMSQANKNDYTYQELAQALKTCEVSEFRSPSKRYFDDMVEAPIRCQSKEPTFGPLLSLGHVTRLSTNFALGHLNGFYICLEKIPGLVAKPKDIDLYRFVRAQASSPLSPDPKVDDQSKAHLTPTLCDGASFVERHADESILGKYLAKTNLTYTEAVEAAFGTCGIPMGESPLRTLRLMRHFEVLCGANLNTPPTDGLHTQWISITQKNQMLVGTSNRFFCLSKTKALSH
jgi:hypothetical protein